MNSFKRFDFELMTTENKSKILALTGPSGSGKSTFMKDYKRQANNVKYFSAKYFVFDGTLEDNIKLGRDDIDSGFVKDLINKFIPARFEGLNDNISNKTLSLGEIQRVCLIRNIISSNDKVVMLDEPTSALNSKVEKCIIDFLIGNQNKFDFSKLVICTHSNYIKERVKEVDIRCII